MKNNFPKLSKLIIQNLIQMIKVCTKFEIRTKVRLMCVWIILNVNKIIIQQKHTISPKYITIHLSLMINLN